MAHVRYTDKAVVSGVAYGKLPVIISANLQVHRLSLKYLLNKRLSCTESSLNTYARHLCDFVSQLETFDTQDDVIDWDDINDLWLENYANELKSRYGQEADNTSDYVAQVLRTVLKYLEWAQSSGYTKNLVGYDDDARIRLLPAKDGKDTISHPLIKKYSQSQRRSKTAPRQAWIDAVKQANPIKNRESQKRFDLMIDWGSSLGLRIHEIVALKIDQLPSRETSEKAYLNEESVFIELVVTKGGKHSRNPVSPLLIIKTWDFIEFERVKIVNKFKLKARRLREPFHPPAEIFLSTTTCKALTPKAFSNQVKAAWNEAVRQGLLTEDEYVWPHGLRHRFSTDSLKEARKKGIKDPEELVKHLTRHSHVESLETYTVAAHYEDANDR
ncbi:MAG: hypothetical protein K6L74_15145 [Neptuniibacter sp.]